MTGIILLGIMLISFWFGMFMILNHLKAQEHYKPRKKECPPHDWQEHETAPGSNVVYLKCRDCKRTLSDILGN